MIEAAMSRRLALIPTLAKDSNWIWRNILLVANSMISLLMIWKNCLIIIIAIPPTNTSDDCFQYCCQRGLADFAWFPSWSLSNKTSLICYMQAGKVLYDAVKANDVAAVRNCLALGTHVDLDYVRYQSFLFHLILHYSHYTLSIQLVCVCLSISPLSCSFAFFRTNCL